MMRRAVLLTTCWTLATAGFVSSQTIGKSYPCQTPEERGATVDSIKARITSFYASIERVPPSEAEYLRQEQESPSAKQPVL